MFAEAPSSSSSRQPILQADACGGTRAAPRSPMLPEETPDNPPLPQPGWQHSLGRHKPHELHPLQPPAIPQPIQTSGSDQLDPGATPSHPALPTSPLSTSVGHPAAHSLNDDLEDGEIDEHTAPEAPVPPSQKPAQNAPQKKRTKKKNKKEQNQQPPLPTDDSSSLSRKQKKARARQAKRDRQTACRQALDRIDAFEPTAEDEERLQSLMATPPPWIKDLEWTQAILKRFAKICSGKVQFEMEASLCSSLACKVKTSGFIRAASVRSSYETHATPRPCVPRWHRGLLLLRRCLHNPRRQTRLLPIPPLLPRAPPVAAPPQRCRHRYRRRWCRSRLERAQRAQEQSAARLRQS